METRSPFLDTIFLLRKDECITLFSNVQEISPKEEDDAEIYFETEFEKERLEFFSDRIVCNKKAAVWAAKIVYHSAQLYLIRKNTEQNMRSLIPEYKETKDISTVLSADLALRFLPQIITALHSVDPEDVLIKMLENILTEFHYSGIGHDLDLKHINWGKELEDKTYRKLYLERIVEKRDYKLAEIPLINKLLIAEFGMHKEAFWRELKIITEENQ
ncbi:hypothetical protein C1637_09430 [Chryseobacterium lactis]|uniref:MoxR-vWA-beta-propeller ternary system domain-containing protein n=1 Tax=Chryseobacterium lactis TaxID=1241981 RepID=A0A3G6RHH8_CHRLC|nr:hypothetical protein [Chryseobacterium lactis]AZA82267.1 hypothetical protein EG342_10275 [Chryseobacterium lactis]AZB02649.1 hypothetical protein EG341_01135 [Chryseobacterium lactis]PNW14059.1 hypothetical protein C1637_09430 [Chryseobacterium lactis]